jgi:pSer/pThr/pTyr-binding forkhead associated (FHA) protein
MRKLTITTATGPVAHELAEDLISLGRSPENLIQLDDPSISSRHAQLELVGNDYCLKDLGSTNGTRVNGEAVSSVTLRSGDRVRFGKVEASFESESGTAAHPLPALAAVAAKPAEVSARPADFANASPFLRRKMQSDSLRAVIFAAAGIAILAFLASMMAVLLMRPPAL